MTHQTFEIKSDTKIYREETRTKKRIVAVFLEITSRTASRSKNRIKIRRKIYIV